MAPTLARRNILQFFEWFIAPSSRDTEPIDRV